MSKRFEARKTERAIRGHVRAGLGLLAAGAFAAGCQPEQAVETPPAAPPNHPDAVAALCSLRERSRTAGDVCHERLER